MGRKLCIINLACYKHYCSICFHKFQHNWKDYSLLKKANSKKYKWIKKAKKDLLSLLTDGYFLLFFPDRIGNIGKFLTDFYQMNAGLFKNNCSIDYWVVTNFQEVYNHERVIMTHLMRLRYIYLKSTFFGIVSPQYLHSFFAQLDRFSLFFS